MISAALVAALVGFGSTIALVLAAAAAVGASPAQTASWVAAICIAKAAGSALLSAWKRVPVVLAWSTPGAALIAGSSGIDIGAAVGAFMLTGVLIALTGALPPVARLVGRIPGGIAAAMLAGVLLPFCMAVARHATEDAARVLPIIGVFLVVRLFSPVYATLSALATGLAIGLTGPDFTVPALHLSAQPFVFVAPVFDPGVLIGLGLPLYLVTMASQNLPGFAVMRANGFEPPVSAALGVSGALSAVSALFGAHPVNMAAITAAICLGDDVSPDRGDRWKVGLAYGFVWVCLGIFSPVIIAIILALPPAIIAVVAGLALLTPFIGAASAAFDAVPTRFPAAATLAVTASGMAAWGIGAAFWGLMAGLAILGLDRIKPAIWRR